MARSKQNKNKGGKDKDGKHRKETKEERKDRLRQQEEAREACTKILPYFGGVLLILLIVFALYVRSVPPKVPISVDIPAQSQAADKPVDFTDTDATEVAEEASDVLENLETEGGGEKEETIEL